MKKTKWILLFVIIFVLFLGCLAVLDYYSLLPKKAYSNEDFGISTYRSSKDYDQDGIDDQTDLLMGAREYVAKKPKYKSKYYASGYPDDEYGVCTDVVAQAFLHAGYDLRELVDEDIRANPEEYEISVVDKNIDFRRVKNLMVFFERNAQKLSVDKSQIDQWQGGDIVIFPHHIAIVSSKRNKQGVSYIIHHGGQPVYEEDALARYEIIGHYRWK